MSDWKIRVEATIARFGWARQPTGRGVEVPGCDPHGMPTELWLVGEMTAVSGGDLVQYYDSPEEAGESVCRQAYRLRADRLATARAVGRDQAVSGVADPTDLECALGHAPTGDEKAECIASFARTREYRRIAESSGTHVAEAWLSTVTPHA